MSVLRMSLPRNAAEEEEAKLSGLPLAFSLFEEGKGNSVVFLSPGQEALRSALDPMTSIVYRSPVTDDMALGFYPLEMGLWMRSAGIDALVLEGTCRNLSIIYLADRTAGDARGCREMGPGQLASLKKSNPSDFLLSVGRAAMNGVLFSSLMAERTEIPATGLGAVLARKGIKGIVSPGFERVPPEPPPLTGRAGVFLREGQRSLIDSDLRQGSLPVRNWSSRYDPRAAFFDEKAFQDLLAQGYAGKAFPSYRESKLLGANLGSFRLSDVLELAEAVSEAGLDIAYTGAILASRRCGHQERLALLGKISEGFRITHRALLDSRGMPFESDLRGSFQEAVLAVYGLPSVLLASKVMPGRALPLKAAVSMALLESVYGYALLSEGYSPKDALASFWGKFPGWLFRAPLLMLPFFPDKGLLRKGLQILEKLEKEPCRLPDKFILDPESDFDDRTVRQTALIDEYALQKARLKRHLKERREKSSIPDGESSAAVGPDEDLGREGEPGLSANQPPLSL